MRCITTAFVLCLLAIGVLAASDAPPVSLSEGPAPHAWVERKFYSGSNPQYICKAQSSRATANSWTVADSALTSLVDAANTVTGTTASAHGLYPGIWVTVSGTTFSVNASTLTNVVVSSDTGTVTTPNDHGLLTGDHVTFSGCTEDSDLDGEYVLQSAPTTKTFTITTSSVGDGTYDEAGLWFVTGDDELLGTFEVLTAPTATTFTFTSADVTDGTYDEVGLGLAGTFVPDTSALWSIEKRFYDGSNNHTGTLHADGDTEPDNVCADRATITTWR